MKKLVLLMLAFASVFANEATSLGVPVDLTSTLFGIVILIIFVVGYYFIAAEEKYHVDKAKPALFIGTFMFILIAIYYAVNGLDGNIVEQAVHHTILEIAQIFFFLYVAMTYIEALVERDVFNALKYNLVSKGYGYKKLFWLTGTLAFFISPVADNLTTALILSTVLITINKTNHKFLVPGAINIVVAANAGGAWSPFGDITTLMAWVAGKAPFGDFFFLFPASFLGWLVTAYLLSLYVPNTKPNFDPTTEPRVKIKDGGKAMIFLGVATIISAVLAHQVLHLPAVWGMLFGLAMLKLYAIKLGRKLKMQGEHYNVFHSIAKIENNTLLFFFGILAAVSALHFVGYLTLAVGAYDAIGATWANIGVGLISAIVDNVPVMSAILKANPAMGIDQWLLVTMTAGIGGSLISFGSAAGVGVMGRLSGIYTFGAHMKLSWTVLAGYIISLAIWYIQFEILGVY